MVNKSVSRNFCLFRNQLLGDFEKDFVFISGAKGKPRGRAQALGSGCKAKLHHCVALGKSLVFSESQASLIFKGEIMPPALQGYDEVGL